MDKKNVLMVGPDRLVHGGISGVVNLYYEAGLETKVNLKYIGTMREGSKISKLLVAMCAYFSFILSLPKYDIVHIHAASDRSFERKSFFVRAAYKHHKKIILHQHGGDFINWYNSLPDKKKEKVQEVLDMADKMLVLAPNWQDYFGNLTDKSKIIVFPNTIPIPENFDKDYKNKKILFLGRICEAKGIRELIGASKELRSTFPEVTIELGGIWEDKKLEKEIREDCPNIRYLGWLTGENKDKALREASIFVMPSHFEGQCISIVEAMARGCAIVASNTGGIPMMVHDRETGILVEPKSSKSLYEGIRSVLEDIQLMEQLGKHGREMAASEYNIENAIKKLYEEVY